MAKIVREPVIECLHSRGQVLVEGVRELLRRHEIEEFLSISGHPSWSLMSFRDAAPYTQWQIKTLWMQEVLRRGFLSVGSHNMSFAHTDEDVAKLLECYDEVFEILAASVRGRTLEERLNCETLVPLFRVR